MWKPSPFFSKRGNYPLDMIVIHHVGSKNGKLFSPGGTIRWFTDLEVHRNKDTDKIENKVSAHYLITREPYQNHDVVAFVNDWDVAYHAGRSEWEVDGKKRSGINKYSIGIELEGDGNLVEYTDFQYDTLITLIKEIREKYPVADKMIVGHEEVSPGRKVDPGKYFDWVRLMKGIEEKPEPIKFDPVEIKPYIEKPTEEKVSEEEFFMEGGKEENPSFFQALFSILSKLFSR
jgi:AmpD protein